jgi:threonine/homoserine/homoserine lactone efflux protein
MDAALLVAAIVFIAPMCFTPGPNNVLCAAHGAKYGVRATLPLTLGMALGWSALGIVIGLATDLLEQEQVLLRTLEAIGAFYIAYIGLHVMRSDGVGEADLEGRLGFRTGVALQFVNGKAWIHFLVLMAGFGSVFGQGSMAKVALVGLNLSFGYPAVLTWTVLGAQLRRLFASDTAGRRLNATLGALLVGVAAWLLMTALL